jgi:hypothetical protein
MCAYRVPGERLGESPLIKPLRCLNQVTSPEAVSGRQSSAKAAAVQAKNATRVLATAVSSE